MSRNIFIPVPLDYLHKGKAPAELWEQRKKSQILGLDSYWGTSYWLDDEIHQWFADTGRTYRLKLDNSVDSTVVIAIKSRRTAMLFKLTWHGR